MAFNNTYWGDAGEWWKQGDLGAGGTGLQGLYFKPQDFSTYGKDPYGINMGDSDPMMITPWLSSDNPLYSGGLGRSYDFTFNEQGIPTELIAKSADKEGTRYGMTLDPVTGNYVVGDPTGTFKWDTNDQLGNWGPLIPLLGAAAFSIPAVQGAVTAAGEGLGSMFTGAGAAGGATEPVASLNLFGGGAGTGTGGAGFSALETLADASATGGLGMEGLAPAMYTPNLNTFDAFETLADAAPTGGLSMDSVKSGGTSLLDILKNLGGGGTSGGGGGTTQTGAGGSNLLDFLLKGAGTYFANQERNDLGQKLEDLYKQQLGLVDPFLSRLRTSYEDPQSVFTSPEFSSGRDLYKNRIDREAANTGGLSNTVQRQMLLDKYGANYMKDYRGGLSDVVKGLMSNAGDYKTMLAAGLANQAGDAASWSNLLGSVYGDTKSGGINWSGIGNDIGNIINAGGTVVDWWNKAFGG